MESEIAIPRYLIDKKDVTWSDSINRKNIKNWTLQMNLKVNPELWGPRDLMRPELVWNEEEGTLTEVIYHYIIGHYFLYLVDSEDGSWNYLTVYYIRV